MEDHHKFYGQGVYIPPIYYIIDHKLSVLPGCCPENLKMYTCTVLTVSCSLYRP